MAFATSYKSSNKPSKQRLYAYNAPLHIKGKMLAAHLSKELREKLKTRSLRVRVGDKVIVMTGQYRKKTGKVEAVDVHNHRVYITGIDRARKDGSKASYPFNPSNLLITEIVEDKKRTQPSQQKKVEQNTKPVAAKPAVAKSAPAKTAPKKGESQ
jgi:large subunit ribosomal protein L24